MDTILQHELESLNLGERQDKGPVTILPILNGNGHPFHYLTLTRALQQGLVTITEVSEGGSVPDLLVHNDGTIPVLLIDGEEISGAKQNRVLNTSILVPAASKLKVPVSCTEQGRWGYTSRTFDDSGVVAARKVRLQKNRSVRESLEHSLEFRADQGEVWDNIADYAMKLEAPSPTGAMRDSFRAREPEVQNYLAAFPRVANQRGLVVLAGGRVLGLDLVSRSDAYETLHDKLVKSYVLDVLAEKSAPVDTDATAVAEAFLGDVRAAEEKAFESPGLGMDHRLSGRRTFGAGLLHADEVIHLSCFPHEDDGPNPDARMAGFRQRRRFRGR